MSQRSQQYHDLEHALCVLTVPAAPGTSAVPDTPSTLAVPDTPSTSAVPDTPELHGASAVMPDMGVPNTLVYMYCLETGCIGTVLKDTNLYRNLSAMATPFTDTYTNKIDVYFTYSGFVSQWQLALQQRNLLVSWIIARLMCNINILECSVR